MAGKRCKGDTDTAKLKESKAMCEGRTAAYNGLDKALDNPHPATSADGVAWIAGFDSYQAGVGAALPQDCCDRPALDGVP